jgi:hypothetical protein
MKCIIIAAVMEEGIAHYKRGHLHGECADRKSGHVWEPSDHPPDCLEVAAIEVKLLAT